LFLRAICRGRRSTLDWSGRRSDDGDGVFEIAIASKLGSYRIKGGHLRP
jgi:hypothetical protein